MRRNSIIALVVFAIALIAGGYRLREPPPADPQAGATTQPRIDRAAGRQSSEMVLSIAPGLSRGGSSAPPAPRLTPLMDRFARRQDFKAIHAQLSASTARTAEESYVLAEILDRCAKVTDRKLQPRYELSLAGEKTRARFIDALSPRDPNREKRIAALDRMNRDECAGLRQVQATEAEIRALFEEAARSGDPKARARILIDDLQATRRNAAGEIDWSKPVEISEAQLDEFRGIVASADPRALVDVVQLAGINFSNFSLRGPDDAVLDNGALYAAATLAACDLGYPCGPDAHYLLQACALNGECDAANYRDHLFFYGAAPATSQRILEYHRQLQRVIREGDWSWFNFHRGPTPLGSAIQRR
jgi:hypothetical protein